MKVRFSFKGITAREISKFNRAIKVAPEEAETTFADILAKCVVEFEGVKGKLNKPDTYLDLPYFPDPDDEDAVSFTDLMRLFGEALSKVQKGSSAG